MASYESRLKKQLIEMEDHYHRNMFMLHQELYALDKQDVENRNIIVGHINECISNYNSVRTTIKKKLEHIIKLNNQYPSFASMV